MKKIIKTLIVISFVLMFYIFNNTYYCSAQTLEKTTSIPVTGRIIFNENINNNIPNKDDVQGIFPIKPPFNTNNQDNSLIDVPKTGDKSESMYWLIILLAALLLIYQYKKTNYFEKEELLDEKKKINSIN